MVGILLTQDLLISSQITSEVAAHGGAVSTSASVEELLVRAAKEPVTLVLVDLSMPGIDIGQLVRQLRELQPGPRSVVAFAPHVHTAKLDAAARAGCDRVLTRGQLCRDPASVLSPHVDDMPRDSRQTGP